jgi:hypothetical protein
MKDFVQFGETWFFHQQHNTIKLSAYSHNLFATVQNGVIRGTLLAMRFMGKDKGGKGGTVVNIGSNTSMRPYVSAPIYSATKHAVLGFTRSFGVRVSIFYYNGFFLCQKLKFLFLPSSINMLQPRFYCIALLLINHREAPNKLTAFHRIY